MINHPFQHFQYETNVTGFFLVHVEISVTNERMENTLKVMTPEETKVRRKNLGHLFPRNKCNKRNEGKVNDKSSFSTFTI